MSSRIQRRFLIPRLGIILIAATMAASAQVTQSSSVKSPGPIHAAITSDTFTNGAGSGLWNNASNWSGGLPSSSSNVLITGSGSASAVTQNVAAEINNLTLNLANSWTLNNTESLKIDGNSIGNAGKMLMNSTGNVTELIVNSPLLTLSGGGTLTMSNNANNYIFGSATADTLQNQETIQGAGHIGNGQMTLINSGIINANQSAGITIDANGGASNSGTFEATSGSTLAINSTTVYNAGTIGATGTGSVLQLNNTNVYGGTVSLTGASTLQLSNGSIQFGSTLNNSSTGTIEAIGFTNNTLGGTIINPTGGLLKLDNGAVLNLASGSYPTLGAVQMNSTGNVTELVVQGGVTLSGGSVTLSNNANNYIFGAASGDTLNNQETIQGAGHIGNGQMTLINSGTINANQSAGMTIQPNGGITNTGTIAVGSGATLNILDTTVANTGGKILANTGTLQVSNTTINGGTVTLTGPSTLQLSNGIIHGGSTLTNSSTGTLEVIGFTNNTLGGTITNPTGGLLKLDNGAVLNLASGSYPTLGAVQMNSTGNVTELVIQGGTTLSGGSVALSNNPNNYIFGAAAGDTLTNQETIQGAGHIGNGQMTLINPGTINANQSSGMTIAPNGGTTNTGLIEANGGATLAFSGTTINNAGGTISSNGSTLQVTNSTINGGAVTLTGASTLQLSSGIIHGGALANSSTGTIEAIGFTNNTLGGTINNPSGGLLKIDNAGVLNLENGTYSNLGALQLNSTGSVTELVINGGVTLSGGSITLSNNPNNFIFGGAAGDTFTNQDTIQGAGNIGDNRMTLINAGTINANQSNTLFVQTNAFTNTGTLQVAGGSLMHVEGGIFTNFNPVISTLTGGTYNTSGTLEIDNLGTAGGEIVTNAANIVLNGASSSFVDAAGKNALSNFATNASAGKFTVSGGRAFNTAGAFTNNGTLTVGSGSNFTVNGNLNNFSGTTLIGGVYNVTGTLKFNNANIVTNAANLTLNGASSQILNQSSANGIANFAANAASGAFTVQGGRTFTTVGSFTNAGAFTIGAGSTFTIGGTGSYTQTGGSTTDNGTLALPSAGKLSLNSGSLFGAGTITGAVTSSGSITPGASAASTAILKDTGAYTQNSTGTLNVAISGTTAGAGYDQFNPTTAKLGGTLNITRPTGFIPTVGSTFKIMNFSSETGSFAAVNGLAINSSEHFTVTVQSTDVLVTVASGAAVPLFRSFKTSSLRDSSSSAAYRPATFASMPSFQHPAVAAFRTAAIAQQVPRNAGGVRRTIARNFVGYNLNLLSVFEGGRSQALHNILKQPGNPDAASLGSFTFSY